MMTACVSADMYGISAHTYPSPPPPKHTQSTSALGKHHRYLPTLDVIIYVLSDIYNISAHTHIYI